MKNISLTLYKSMDNSCSRCGKECDIGFRQCDCCRSKAADRQRQLKLERISLGVCLYCGRNRAVDGQRGCVECNKKQTDRTNKSRRSNPNAKEWQRKSNKKRTQHRLDNKLCVQCGKPSDTKLCDVCRLYQANKHREYREKRPELKQLKLEQRRQLKREVIDKYGGKCECCGESNWQFLAIDHKNGDGGVERKKLYGSQGGGSGRWYLKLKKEPRRDDLRVLCHNCNLAIAFYGECPHEIKSSVDLTGVDLRGGV